MGGSRRRLKKSRSKVRVGLPRKKPHVFKPAFSIPPKLRSLTSGQWDETGSVLSNYKSFGVVSNPNFLGVRARTSHMIENDKLQVPLLNVKKDANDNSESSSKPTNLDFNENNDANDDSEGSSKPKNLESMESDSGSDLEEDDLKSALGKKRRDGKTAPLQPLTTIQRIHISRLVSKYDDDYQSMFMDTKLNAMQHSVGALKKLCRRYYVEKKQQPCIGSQ